MHPRTTLFKDLSTEAITKVIDGMEYRRFESGTDLVTQGEAATELMVIMEGTATVYQDGNVVRQFGKFDIIGEIAMMPGDNVRGATVTAEGGDVGVLLLSKDRYTKLKEDGTITQMAHDRARRKSIQYLDEDEIRRRLAASVVTAPPPPRGRPPKGDSSVSIRSSGSVDANRSLFS